MGHVEEEWRFAQVMVESSMMVDNLDLLRPPSGRGCIGSKRWPLSPGSNCNTCEPGEHLISKPPEPGRINSLPCVSKTALLDCKLFKPSNGGSSLIGITGAV